MDTEEREICAYLKSLPGQFISAREIARRAGGKSRHQKNPFWATKFLAHLVEKKVLERDPAGHYRLAVKDSRKDSRKKWVSPQMKKILASSGKDFTHIIPDDEELPE
jgi:hypothetical protein